MIGRPHDRDAYDSEKYDDWLESSRPDGLEELWRAVQTALGPDGTVAGVSRGTSPTDWSARCTGPRGFELTGTGHNPADAMRDLLDRIKDVRQLEDHMTWRR